MLIKPKIQNLAEIVLDCIRRGNYYDTRHVVSRQAVRNINRMEVLYILKNGRHEKRKDQYQERYKAWNYAIRGRTLDKRELRVVVSFDENNMLIITAIELGV